MEQVTNFIYTIFDAMISFVTVYPINVVFYLSCCTFIAVLIKRQLLVGIRRNKK